MSKLKCRYVAYHPFLKIAPVKEEQMFDNPPIWLFHDVITEQQVQRMKYLAGPKVRLDPLSNLSNIHMSCSTFSSSNVQLFEVQSLESMRLQTIE